MFAVPKWEKDVPNTYSNFEKIKRKHRKNKMQISSDTKVTEFDSDKPDEVLLNTKKKKLSEAFKNDDIEDLLFSEKSPQNKKSIANLKKSATKKVSKKRKKDKIRNYVKKTALSQNNLDTMENTDLQNIGDSVMSSKRKRNTDNSVFSSKKQQNTNKGHKKDKFNNNAKKTEVSQTDLYITGKTDPQNTDNSDIITERHLSTDKINKNPKKEKIRQVLRLQSMKSPLISKIKKIQNDPMKKEKINELLKLSAQRNSILTNGSKLRQRMLERLKSAQFRYLNEKLYTSSGSEARQLFESDPTAFQTYHQGYQQQVKKWPVNPLEIIIKTIKKLPKTYIVADMGCGEAHLSRRVAQTVRSFDLVSQAPCVELCDMAHTPLLAASVHVAVYCLALMGTDLTQYLLEANRVLKMGGLLLIAEVESRFDDVELFTRAVQQLGFKLNKLDKTNQVFFFMEFTKIRDPPVKKSKLPTLSLKPCLYKKR